MHAITIWQPWASLIAAGIKRYETRGWWPPDRLSGQRIAIHAAAADRGMSIMEHQGGHLAQATGRLLATGPLPFGAIIATARLAVAIPTTGHPVAAAVLPAEKDLGDWSTGRLAWLLADVRPLTTPLPCRGLQRLWRVPAHLVAALRRQGDPC